MKVPIIELLPKHTGLAKALRLCKDRAKWINLEHGVEVKSTEQDKIDSLNMIPYDRYYTSTLGSDHHSLVVLLLFDNGDIDWGIPCISHASATSIGTRVIETNGETIQTTLIRTKPPSPIKLVIVITEYKNEWYGHPVNVENNFYIVQFT